METIKKRNIVMTDCDYKYEPCFKCDCIKQKPETRCKTRCETRDMIGMSWWKKMGYNFPCSCAWDDWDEYMENERLKKEKEKPKPTFYRADYVQSSFFKLPAGTNLDDKSVVEWYCVKYDVMYVKYVAIEEEVEYYSVGNDEDLKYPYKVELDEDFYLSDSDNETNETSETDDKE